MASLRQLLQALATAATDADGPGPSVAWTDTEWVVFLGLARFHGLTPWLGSRVQREAWPDLPGPRRDALVQDFHRCRLFHRAAAERLAELLDALSREGVAALPLKGPTLANEAYPAPGLRPFEDLDVLVEPSAIPTASAVLRRLGYAPLQEPLGQRLAARYHFHTQWRHSVTRQCVELHWRPADLRTLPAPNGDDAFPFRQRLAEVPAAMSVYLAVHLAKHGFGLGRLANRRIDPLLALHPWLDVRRIWVMDFTRLIEARQLPATAIHEEARLWNAEGAVAQARYLAEASTAAADYRTAHQALSPWSPKGRILRAAEASLDRPAHMPRTPRWLRAGPRTGFRPVRLLDLVEGRMS